MKVICHRGYHIDGTDNTVHSFEQAVSRGFDGIETDVRLSSDGHLILYHDRVAPSGKLVEELDHQRLEDAVGFHVPTVEEVLKRWPKTFWDFEIKSSSAVGPIIAALREPTIVDNLLITSFQHDLVESVANQLPIACGLLVAHRPIDMGIDLCRAWSLIDNVRTIICEFDVLSPMFVDNLTAASYRVFAYGPVTREDHKSCRAMGLTGVITDFPDLIDHEEL